jgi:choline dehydrogenase-like flavoprotein
MRPLSRGYVEAKSNRPGDAPAINPRYLSEESDGARSSAACDWRGGCSPPPR